MVQRMAVPDGVAERSALLDWYDPVRYPWRGGESDPYRVLVSEVMLQQTQAARVAPAFECFVERFPSVQSLAAAALSDVLRAWGRLGYNRRALALAETARAIVRDHSGVVPGDPDLLAQLPGVGPYTAAAVASIGHGVPVAAIDTNVRRVVARARLGVEPEDASSAALRNAADAWLDRTDPGGWNQAVMDLGRIVCRPAPLCGACPLAPTCRSRRAGRPAAVEGRRRPAPRQPRFEGSMRQVRGSVMRVLRRGPATMARLISETDHPIERVRIAVAALAADGLVTAGPAALAGRPSGRVRLADEIRLSPRRVAGSRTGRSAPRARPASV
jgi:A/G-specific adenine glycosylase